MMNAGLRDDMPQRSSLTGADGIGLFRTEFQFLVSATLPQRERQTRLYRDVLEAAGDKPVIFRTVDIGGDKVAALSAPRRWRGARRNPAMGWRALRLALERDGLLKVQARALLEAAAGRTLNVMFPMVSEPWEFDEAKAVFEQPARSSCASQKKPLPEAIRYGAMLEVPALAEMLDVLLPKHRLPVDRHQRPDPVPVRRRPRQSQAGRALRLAQPGDPALPPARRRADRRPSVSISTVCGEMGGRQLEALALIGLGITRLSITPAAVGPIKELVCRTISPRSARPWMAGSPHRPPIMRAELQAWAAQNDILMD